MLKRPRKLLGARASLLGAPGIATRSKDATRNKKPFEGERTNSTRNGFSPPMGFSPAMVVGAWQAPGSVFTCSHSHHSLSHHVPQLRTEQSASLLGARTLRTGLLASLLGAKDAARRTGQHRRFRTPTRVLRVAQNALRPDQDVLLAWSRRPLELLHLQAAHLVADVDQGRVIQILARLFSLDFNAFGWSAW